MTGVTEYKINIIVFFYTEMNITRHFTMTSINFQKSMYKGEQMRTMYEVTYI